MIQATGADLPGGLDTAPNEAKELLTQALRGKRVNGLSVPSSCRLQVMILRSVLQALLILDDAWKKSDEEMLNAIDVSAGSRVLVTTRIKELLNEAEQLEVGLPSPADAAELLLKSAGAA